MAIGWHAVRRSEIKKGDVAIVIGCGPVGLAVICMLKARGVRNDRRERLLRRPARARRAPAARTSSSTRRGLTLRGGDGRGLYHHRPERAELAVGTMEKLSRLPVPWHHVWRAAETLGAEAEAPRDLRVRRRPRDHRRHHRRRAAASPAWSSSASAWSRTGSARRWRSTRRSTCASSSATRRSSSATPCTCSPRARSTRRRSSPARWACRESTSAFDALGDPEAHAKILIDPKSTATGPVTAGHA